MLEDGYSPYSVPFLYQVLQGHYKNFKNFWICAKLMLDLLPMANRTTEFKPKDQQASFLDAKCECLFYKTRQKPSVRDCVVIV